VNCEQLRNSQSELTAIWGLGSGRKRNGQREGKVTERLEFGQDAAISVEEEAILVQSYNSRARDLDLEHTLAACSPSDDRVQVWSQSSHLCGSRSDLRKKLTDEQTEKQMMDATRLY